MPSLRPLLTLLTAAMLVMATAGPAAASPWVVSGTVQSDSGEPLVDALVEFRDDLGVAGDAWVDATGYYEASVPTGTYDVHVTPAPDSPFTATTLPGQVVTDDLTLDIVLSQAGTVEVSGRVLVDGAPVAGARVHIDGSDGAYTSVTGEFSMQALTGPTRVWVQLENGMRFDEQGNWIPESPDLPTSIDKSWGTIDIGQDGQIGDLHLEMVEISGRVVDADGTGIAGTAVQAEGSNWFPDPDDEMGELHSSSAQDYAQTDDQGNFTLYAVPGQIHVWTDPPADSGYASTSAIVNTTSGDRTLGFLLQFGQESTEETFGDGGGTATTDEGDGATASDPIETAVTSPVGGTVTIIERTVQEPEPSGYQFLTQTIDITAPEGATAEDPLVLEFELHESRVADGTLAEDIDIFRNGVIVPDCEGPGITEDHDPCVVLREHDAPVYRFTVLTTAASYWNLAGPPPAPATGTISGRLQLDDGASVVGACVEAFELGSDAAAGLAISGAGGHYEIADVTRGTYQLRVSPCDSGFALTPVWFPSATERSTASSIAVVAGLTTTGVDFVLTPTTDQDDDGLDDLVDNCPGVANPDQADLDDDGRGDVCDDETTITIEWRSERSRSIAKLLADNAGSVPLLIPGNEVDVTRITAVGSGGVGSQPVKDSDRDGLDDLRTRARTIDVTWEDGSLCVPLTLDGATTITGCGTYLGPRG